MSARIRRMAQGHWLALFGGGLALWSILFLMSLPDANAFPGGLGFIGSNLALRLVELGSEVMLVDSLIPEYGGNLHNIESRPSDAMNIAIRMGVPIYVADEVLTEAGLIPEDDLSEAIPEEELDSERLSVFENYLDQIKPDPPAQDQDDDPDDEPSP